MHLTLLTLALATLLGLLGLVMMLQRERPAARPLGLIVLVLCASAIGAILLLS